MKQYFFSLVIIFLASFSLISCQHSLGKKHAHQFCACSSDLANATIQLKSKVIDQATFDKIAKEHEACLGPEDPLQQLKDKPEELKQFKQDFLVELDKQCPEIAKNLEF